MKIKMGMIGGGTGSFIGPVHRMAARLDNMIEIVSGAFSSDPETSLESGKRIGLDPSRVYPHWREMIEKESALPDHLRPEVIAIVTPNFLHFEQAEEAVNAGFHVMCDKPLTMNLDQALKLEQAVINHDRAFCITHNYTGYPMVKLAREMVLRGDLGSVRKVVTEYLQGWLSEKEEETGNKQAEWRADPARAGIAGCMADIGTHAFQLSEYISGKKVTGLFSQLNSFVEGRILDDDGSVIIEMEDNVKGSIIASQVALGEENNLRIRIYGTLGSISWEQMEPNNLVVRWKNRPYEVYRTATGFPQTGKVADGHSRLPAGHPEGFIEGFANLYRNFALDLVARSNNQKSDPAYDYPGISDGVRGMKFLEAVVKSSSTRRWVTL